MQHEVVRVPGGAVRLRKPQGNVGTSAGTLARYDRFDTRGQTRTLGSRSASAAAIVVFPVPASPAIPAFVQLGCIVILLRAFRG